jgi:hypothetical protein
VTERTLQQLEAAGGQHSGGIRLEISIDSGSHDGVFHGYSAATFFEAGKCRLFEPGCVLLTALESRGTILKSTSSDMRRISL